MALNIDHFEYLSSDLSQFKQFATRRFPKNPFWIYSSRFLVTILATQNVIACKSSTMLTSAPDENYSFLSFGRVQKAKFWDKTL